MPLTIVTAPTVEPLGLEEIEDHLRLSETSTGAEDTVLLTFLTAARRYCEQVQGRAYLHQTWNLILDGFPSESCIEIPRPPLVSITHVKYYGTGGTATTMTAGNYYAATNSEPGMLCLAYGEVWPSATLRPNEGVEIQFLAGYGSVASTVPVEVRQAMKLIIGDMYEHREDSDVKQLSPDWIRRQSFGANALLGLDRIWPV